MKRTIVSLSLKPEIIEYFDELAFINGITRSRMIEIILQRQINEWEEETLNETT